MFLINEVDEIINPLPKNNTKENSWKIQFAKVHLFIYFYNTYNLIRQIESPYIMAYVTPLVKENFGLLKKRDPGLFTQVRLKMQDFYWPKPQKLTTWEASTMRPPFCHTKYNAIYFQTNLTLNPLISLSSMLPNPKLYYFKGAKIQIIEISHPPQNCEGK